MTRAAIIIPVHNGAAHLAACLGALASVPDDVRVIAVENGSVDTSRSIIAAHPWVILRANDTPLGFAGAVNAGVAHALALEPPPDALVLLNQDTLVDPGWLAALLAPLVDAGVGVVGSVGRFADGRVQHAGGTLLLPRGYGANIAAEATALPDELPDPDYVAFFATAIRSACWHTVGGLDNQFGAGYYEDADFCLRAAAHGWRTVIARAATLLHDEGARGELTVQRTRLLERNRLRLALKHRDPHDLLATFAPAERAALLHAARDRRDRPLRLAYLDALLQLPAIAAVHGWDAATQDAVATMLVGLRAAGDHARAHRGAGGMAGTAGRGAGGRGGGGRGGRGAGGRGGIIVRTQHAASLRDASAARRPPVSIIIITWNGIDVTRACLASLREKTQGIDYRLVFVDNGSTDGTLEWLRGEPGITLVENGSNLGFVRGVNRGLDVIPAHHDVLLLNNDTLFVQPHWLAHLRDVAHSHIRYGLVGCTLLHADGTLQHAGAMMPTDTFWGYQIGGGETFVGQYPGVRVVEGVTGAVMYIRADLRAAIGGMDEAFVSYFEDTDYCLRAQQAGFLCVCTGAVQVLHLENTSTRLNRADWRAMFARGRVVFTDRWRAALHGRYQRTLGWRGDISGRDDAAAMARDLLGALDARGIDMRPALDGPPPHIGVPPLDQLLARADDRAAPHLILDGTRRRAGSGPRIGWLNPAYDTLTADEARFAATCDFLLVPTGHAADVVARSELRVPVRVVPPGVDLDHYHPGIVAQRLARGTVFLAYPRPEDDLALLLDAYRRAFRAGADVLLLVYLAVGAHAGIQPTHGGAAMSIVRGPWLQPWRAAVLYRSADVYLAPWRSGAWDARLAAALACGTPALASNWGAPAELVTPATGLPLRTTRGLADADLRQAMPDTEHLVDLLRTAASSPQALGDRGRAAAIACGARTWQASAAAIIDIVEQL